MKQFTYRTIRIHDSITLENENLIYMQNMIELVMRKYPMPNINDKPSPEQTQTLFQIDLI